MFQLPASTIGRFAGIALSIAASVFVWTPSSRATPHVRPATGAGCFAELAERGVAGGRLAGVLPASVERLEALLLDFDHASGHRAWFRQSSLLAREGDRVLARWEMEGRLGIHPTVTLEFNVDRRGSGTLITYRLKRRAFGLALFSGCYRLQPLSDEPPRSRLTQTVYIDSGLPFVGASEEDVMIGLREDLDFLREWLAETARNEVSPHPPE